MTLKPALFLSCLSLLALSGCQWPVSNSAPTTNTVTHVTASLKQAQTQGYGADVTDLSDPGTILYTYRQDRDQNLHTTDLTQDPPAETIYQPDPSSEYILSGSNWIKLTLSKINPVKTLALNDIFHRLALPLLPENIVSVDPITCDQGDCHQVTLLLDDDLHQLTLYQDQIISQQISLADRSYRLDYHYAVPPVDIPAQYEEFTLPQDPTEADLIKLEAIYSPTN